MRAVGYIRVSGIEQVKEGQGLEIQETKIERYCSELGWELVRVYRDEGISGTERSKRAGLMALLDDSLNDKFDAVVVAAKDRLARETELGLAIRRELMDADCRIFSVNGANLEGRQGKLMDTVELAFSDYERAVISERLLDGRRKRAEKGQYPAGRAPFGYRWSRPGDTKQLLVDPEEAEVVRTIFSLYYRMRSLADLAESLKNAGHVNRAGKPFSRGSLAYILANRLYLGEVAYGDVRAKNPELRVVTPAMWNRAAKVRRKQRRR